MNIRATLFLFLLSYLSGSAPLVAADPALPSRASKPQPAKPTQEDASKQEGKPSSSASSSRGASSSGTETLISSDSFQLDLSKKEGLFSGNVEVTSARFNLKARELAIFLGENGKPERFVARGEVSIQSGDRAAVARQAEYNLMEKKITLTGEPAVKQGGNRVSGNSIVIYPENDRMDVIGRTSLRFIQ